ncbi:hypothetical protein [Methanosarcina sp.]|uniref:hypothetical protein n=1 Tax=Methanosarcina sp. TaxID=2213 RepID=UPI003C77B059
MSENENGAKFVVKRRNASLFKKGLSENENGVVGVVTSLFKKGLWRSYEQIMN